MNDLFWMQQAYCLAMQAKKAQEVPVGAVLVSHDGILLGQGYNQVITQHDPSAHAEIIAIREAAAKIQNYRLENTTLYITLEPCIMCAGTIVQTRIQRIVFATRDWKAGAAGSVYNVLRGYPLNHSVQIDEGPLQQQCAALLAAFFNERR